MQQIGGHRVQGRSSGVLDAFSNGSGFGCGKKHGTGVNCATGVEEESTTLKEYHVSVGASRVVSLVPYPCKRWLMVRKQRHG